MSIIDCNLQSPRHTKFQDVHAMMSRTQVAANVMQADGEDNRGRGHATLVGKSAASSAGRGAQPLQRLYRLLQRTAAGTRAGRCKSCGDQRRHPQHCSGFQQAAGLMTAQFAVERHLSVQCSINLMCLNYLYVDGGMSALHCTSVLCDNGPNHSCSLDCFTA